MENDFFQDLEYEGYVENDEFNRPLPGKSKLQKNSMLNSKPRLLNLILLNLIVRWPTGAAIVRPLNNDYT